MSGMRFPLVLLFLGSALSAPAASKALDAILLPPVYDRDEEKIKLPLVVVRLDNPSKEAIDVVVRIKTEKGLYWPEASEDAFFRAGREHAYVKFEMGCPANDAYAASVSLLDDDGKVLVEFPKRAYRTVLKLRDVRDGKLGESLKVSPGGDRAVKAEHALSVVGSPKDKEPNPDYVDPHSLKLAYALDAGSKHLEIRPQADALKKIEGKPTQLGLWVRGDGSNTQLGLRFTDAVGQTFQPAGVTVDFRGWRFVTIPMTAGRETRREGRGDGEIHYPIRWDAMLLLDNPAKQRVTGEVFFAGLTLIE